MAAPVSLNGLAWGRKSLPKGDLAFAQVGSGPPAVLIHGLHASSHVFGSLILRASVRHRLVLVDLPCSGRSSRYCSMLPSDLADYCAALIGELGQGPALVVGHSFGGLVALELAARHPHRVAGLLVMGSPVLGYPILHPVSRWPLSARVWEKLATPVLATPFAVNTYLKFLWGRAVPFAAQTVTGYLEAIRHPESFDVAYEAIRVLSAYRAPWPALDGFQGPRSVIWGSKDRLVPRRHGEELARQLGAPLVLLPEVGHFVPEERPEVVATEMDKLLVQSQKEMRTQQDTSGSNARWHRDLG